MKRRSRDGCQTCRARKIKCDENQPTCNACKKKGLVCEYGIRWNWVHQPGPALQQRSSVKSAGQGVFVLHEVEYDSDDSLSFPVKKFKLEPQGASHLSAPANLTSYSSIAESAALTLAPLRDAVHLDESMKLWNGNSVYITGSDLQRTFEHYLSHTAPNLVPIPYDDNPFTKLFPSLALHDVNIYKLLAAYGAVHMENSGNTHEPSISSMLLEDCKLFLDTLPNHNANGLLTAAILALIEIDNGNVDAWVYYTEQAVVLIAKNSGSTEFFAGADSELNSVIVRLVGYMVGLGRVCSPTRFADLPSGWWPQWSGSLDYLTGIDLNFIPLFWDTAELVHKRSVTVTAADWADINIGALKILQQLNDYLLEEYRPDSQLTAMCLLYQMALQIHIYRRVLGFSTIHREVRRLVKFAMRTLTAFIPVDSLIQNNMTFTLVTLASEALSEDHRRDLIERLNSTQSSGFVYNTYAMHDIQRCWQTGKSLICESNMNTFL